MGGIFISYRREDTAGHAGRIYDRLRERFGRDRVFMDVAGIEPGVDFVEAIDRAVGSCDVLLVIIGKKWLTCTDASGKRRLEDPKDFIRLETATALRRDIRVVPVLMQDAAMPGEGDLPDDLKKLARRQATEISDIHWDSDTEQLIETLAKVLPGVQKPAPFEVRDEAPAEAKRETPTPAPSTFVKNRLTWIISTVTAVVVALGGLLSTIESYKDTFSRFTSLFSSQQKTAPAVPSTQPQPGTTVPEKKKTPATSLQVKPEVTTTPAPDMVTVPDVTGQIVREAVAVLKDAGLAVESRRTETTRAEPGTVLRQSLRPGSRVRPKETITLIFAVEPRERRDVAARSEMLPSPEQTWPEDGRTFDNYPRTTALRWEAVRGAASYTVELDCMHCCESGKWCSELGRPWKIVRDISVVRSPGYKFEFVGAQPGRWRVWAVDEKGREGEKSPWRTFKYTK